MLEIATEPDSGDIVLDFFAGSGATADAVIQQNTEDGGDRQALLVQMREPIDTRSPAGQFASAIGMQSIADIGRERTKKVIAQQERPAIGLRVLSMRASSTRRWIGVETKSAEAYSTQLEAFADTLLPGWRPEDVIWEVALREGYSLTASIEERTGPNGGAYWRVTDIEKDQAFT
ncbi:MAG: DNA methyltransferase, partial [Roseiarcus sp.]